MGKIPGGIDFGRGLPRFKARAQMLSGGWRDFRGPRPLDPLKSFC